MVKGDIILIPFPFTDLKGNKLRPALVLIKSNFDVTVSFITTQLKWKDIYDLEILPSLINGIKKHSIVRLSKIATIDENLSVGKIGTLNQNEIFKLNQKLKNLFKID
jgi:mRNA interferase MazF